MPLEQFIKRLVAATPSRRIEGKKRLQKLVFLATQAGFNSGANFFLKDYGPFSREVESSADMMSIFGELLEKPVQTGYSNYIATEYSLPEGDDTVADRDLIDLVIFLDSFRTVELEIASTIRFFETDGMSRDRAIYETRSIKPSKSTDKVISSAIRILDHIN